MDKEDVVHIYNTVEYYSVIKREWNNAVCSTMYGPGDYHKWSKSDKDRYHMILLICGLLKKYNDLLFTNQKQTLREWNLWLAQESSGGRDSLGVWDWHIHIANFKNR